MATMLPEPDPAMGAESAPPAAPVKVICISQQADGSYSVYEEAPEAEEAMPGAEAGAEMGGMAGAMGEMSEGAAPGAQPAASIDEALELARGLLQNDGRSPEEQMLAGYSKGAPPAKPTPKQVFGG